jgi:hypothetical protein
MQVGLLPRLTPHGLLSRFIGKLITTNSLRILAQPSTVNSPLVHSDIQDSSPSQTFFLSRRFTIRLG